MRNLLDSEEYEFRYEIGIAQPSGTLQLSDLDRIVETSATHYSIVSVKAELPKNKKETSYSQSISHNRNVPSTQLPDCVCHLCRGHTPVSHCSPLLRCKGDCAEIKRLYAHFSVVSPIPFLLAAIFFLRVIPEVLPYFQYHTQIRL